MIDLVKISEINNINKLKKYSINKPLFFNNYLFHYMIITNNLKGIKLKTYPIFQENDENLNGFLVAAKYGNYKMLSYLIKRYPDYIYNKNKLSENFLHYFNPNDKNYLNLILKNQLDWGYLFHMYSSEQNESISPLDLLFTLGKFKNIKEIISKIDFEYHNYKNTPTFFNLLQNSNLRNREIISLLKIMIKKDKNLFSYVDFEGNNFLYPVVLDDNIDMLKYLGRLNNENINLFFNSYTPINTYHIFRLAYNRGVASNNYRMANYILDKIINKHSFYETNKEGDNLIHFILKNRIINKKGNYDIESRLLGKYNNWEISNVEDKTPIDYLIKLDHQKYSKFLKGKKISRNFKKEKVSDSNWKKTISNLKTNDDNNIKLEQNSYSHGNLFQAKFTDIAIFFYEFEKEYKDLYIPRSNEKIDPPIYSINLKYPDNMLKDYNGFVWNIIWNNKNAYFIHPNLNSTINKNKKKYDYCCCLLSLRLPNDGLHASLIFYDFKKNIVERFDPYGNTKDLDKDMDQILEKELTKNTNLKYYHPGKYFPVAGFQTISDENNVFNQKMGDFGGYCLAWCLWYIEHRIKNKKIDPQELIRKTLNKFRAMKLTPNEYIRNYANKINKKRVNWLERINIPENLISNEILPINYLTKIKLEIIKQNKEN